MPIKQWNEENKYIKIPVNGTSIFSFFVFLLVVTFFGQWFFGNYKLRSPIVVNFQWPYEARVPETIKKVNAEEKKVKVIQLSPSPSPTEKPKKVSLIHEVQAEEVTYRRTIPIKEGVEYIKKKFAEFGEENVKIAVAISKSENFINSHPDYFECDLYGATNGNGTVDLGAMQINSMNWDRYGGEEALKDCFNNWDAGYSMRKSWENWNAWSAYKNGSYKQFMNDEI